ncbi:hypothetical protein B9Z55_007733 [Caenorhabditis nigoni]|uniref:BTB domain-containing protein n=1 Tax=Caenorhabditis nigoni TaxID=1611254 RepID=A0A2G5VAY3_9PELO|nr:hypothetical protein B9Z55_007733 [Caenorhabditis nigoni]
MANNDKGETTPEQSETDELIEKLKLVLENSQKQKFDEIAEKLQSIEKTVSKNSILLNNQNKKEQKPEKRFILKYEFENVTEFEENMHNYSEYEDHYNVKWRVNLVRFNEHLGFFIRCEPIAPADNWSIKTKLEYKVVGKNQKIIRTEDYCYEKIIGWGFDDFLDWDKMRNEYLIDDNLTVEVEVEILKMTGFEKENLRNFDESIKECSDVVLVVNDREFYLSKMFLALQSSYFKSLLLGNFEESQKDKIELKDINPDDFQNFLELIHGESSIDDDTVSGILHLADMYDAPTATRRCEEFLLEKSKKKNVQ